MKNKKLKVIRKKCSDMKCYICKGSGKLKNKPCKACEGTGIFKDSVYIMIANGIAFLTDTIK